MTDLNTYQERLAFIIETTGPKALSDKTGISTSMLQRYKKELNPSDPTGAVIENVLQASGFSGLWLFHKVGPQMLCDIGEMDEANHIEIQSLTGSKSGDVKFDESYLKNFLKVDHENIRHLSVRDDCMAPDYNENDLVLVDSSRKSGAGVFALDMGGDITLRQAITQLNGKIELSCSNPKYPTNEITQEEFEKLNVLGRIIWTGGKA